MKKPMLLLGFALIMLACVYTLNAQPVTIGTNVEVSVSTSHPYNVKNGVVFEQEFFNAGSGYVKIHFSNFDLAEGDYVEIYSPETGESVTYSGKGKVVRGGSATISKFWTASIWSDRAIVRLYSAGKAEGYGFDIDEVAYGYTPEEIEKKMSVSLKKICGTDDKDWAKCHQGTAMYEKAKAVSRLYINGSSACTGWLLGSEGHLMTNNHCIANQTEADNTEYEFMAEGATCNTSCTGWFSCRGTIAAYSGTLVKTSTSYDYALVKLPGNLSTTYGYLSFRSTLPSLGERIYIPQHPGGKGKQISVVDDKSSTGYSKIDRIGTTDVYYFADTEGGSSGSPVLGYSDNLVVALHHTGNCTSGNGGVKNTSVISHIGSSMPANGVEGGVVIPPDNYCSSKGGNFSYEWIAGVNIGSFTNNSSGSGYSDYTSKTIELSPGQTSVSLTPGFASTTYNEYWKIWIDLNNDKDFNDANELVFDAGIMSKTTVNGTLNIPAGTPEVTTRLRVSMKYNGAPTTCEAFSYGEVEDYTVHISSGSTDLQAPTNVATSGITSNSATVSWSQVANATSYEVDYSTNGTNWTTLTANSTSQNLTGLSASTLYQVRVRARNSSSTSSYSSTVSFTTTSTTPDLTAPVNLSASGITTNSFTVSWSAVPNATSYIAEIKPASGANWTAYTASTTSQSFTGLAEATQYQVRVAAVNSQSQSAYSAILTVTTDTGNTNPDSYCASKGQNSAQTYIAYASLYDMSNTSGSDNGYGNYTSKVANVNTGVTTSLYFRTNSNQTVYWKVWIDYNQNNSFESNEEVASATSTNAGYQVAYVTIPSSAASGATRMRVSAKVGSAPTACEAFSEGEVEDYTVNIISYMFNEFADMETAENAVSELVLYPNPVRETLHIKGIEEEETYNIYNASGKLVIHDKGEELNVSELQPGLYLLQTSKNRKFRFVKE